MCQRYFYDLTNGDDHMRDTEGVVASGPDEAIEEARAAMADMRSNEESPVPAEGWQLVIRDESGMTLRSLPLDDGGFH